MRMCYRLMFVILAGLLGCQPKSLQHDLPASDAALSSSSVTSDGTKIKLPNFGQVDEGVFRSARPTRKGIEDFAKMGGKTVLSLETYESYKDVIDQEKSWVEQVGMKFLSFPMISTEQPTLTEIRKALDMIRDSSNQPILVHCHYGRDRTGIVIAAYRIKVQGWSFNQAVGEMAQYGHTGFLGWDNSILNNL